MADLNPSARQVLLDLADRCEREEPSRDLDLAILNAIHAPSPEWVWRSGDETITRLVYGEGAPGNPVCSLDAYTTSLDAAVTLVPEGYLGNLRVAAAKPACEVWRTKGLRLLSFRSDDARKHALALCAAALRARAEAL